MTTTAISEVDLLAPSDADASHVAVTLELARERIHDLALRENPIGPVGLELESHLVDLSEPGARVPWERILDAVAGLSAMPAGSAVTLEPGGQVELSSPPASDIVGAIEGLRRDEVSLRHQLHTIGLGLASLGADPARPVRRGHPGARYVAMDEHFRSAGTGGAGLAMMCSTASIQLNLDAGPRSGWAARVALAHALGPVMISISACSPLLAGRVTGWRSSRQRIWDELDRARCGPLLGGDDPATEWASYALLAPAMLVRDLDGPGAVPVLSRVPFSAWVRGQTRLGGRGPTMADLDYHLTTLFPPVRLRGFLEIRYLDAAPTRWWPALAATLATLLDVPAAADAVADIVAPVARSWMTAARDGLADPALRFAAAACVALAELHAAPSLKPAVAELAELVARGRCPGDEILDVARTDGALAALTREAQR